MERYRRKKKESEFALEFKLILDEVHKKSSLNEAASTAYAED